jgi:hypothetical protein
LTLPDRRPPPRLAFKAVAKTMESEVRAIDGLGAAMET